MGNERKEPTIESVILACEESISHMKLHGLSAVAVIRVLEGMLACIKTIAHHVIATRIDNSKPNKI